MMGRVYSLLIELSCMQHACLHARNDDGPGQGFMRLTMNVSGSKNICAYK